MCAWVRCCGSAKSSKAIYKDGVLYKAFNCYPYIPNGVYPVTKVTGTITNNGSVLTFTVGGGNYRQGSAISEAFDLTNVNTLTVNISAIYSGIGIGLIAENDIQDNYPTVKYKDCTTTGIHYLDTTSLVGKYRMILFTSTGTATTTGGSFSEITLS